MRSILLVALFVAASFNLLADNLAQADAIFQKLLAAESSKNYDAFIADGTTQLKAALTKTQFDAVSELMAPKLAAGYDIIPMGELNQKGCEVYFYGLRFKNGGDDILGTMSLKDGKVAGIYFH
jgi:hypothetical protein